MYEYPNYDQKKLVSKNFYEVDEVCPELKYIYENLSVIQDDVKKVRREEWTDWPETKLYDKKSDIWNIYPFTAFDVVVKENCRRCPNVWKFLQRLPGLKVALLSRLGPNTKLNTHQGWGKHSNNVIRCHFGLDVPYGCYISVQNKEEEEDDKEEIQIQKQNKWLLFDDSRYHYAHNPTDKERIVLIVDIERPEHIAKGNSKVEDTKELQQIIEYFKTKNRLG
jgi:aspartyl/asparaginyl beta-hydroxylase (cupin superfamily)